MSPDTGRMLFRARCCGLRIWAKHADGEGWAYSKERPQRLRFWWRRYPDGAALVLGQFLFVVGRPEPPERDVSLEHPAP